MRKKVLNKSNFLYGFGLVALGFVLFWRYLVAWNRSFDPDELSHLSRAYFISIGRLPYRDFGYQYSPIFAGFFSPLFILFKEQAGVVFLARILNFWIFFLSLLLVYLIGQFAFSRLNGILAAFLWAFFPLGLDKTIEIRPDHLAILFWLAAFLFLLLTEKAQKKTRLIFLSGLSFGLSIAIILKTVFGYLGLLVSLFVLKKNSKKELFQHLFIFHLGIIIPLVFLLSFFLFSGNLKQAVYSIFIMPREIFRSFGKKYYLPFFPFEPNGFLYGLDGLSLPWALSNLAVILGFIGLLKQIILAKQSKNQITPAFLLFSFFLFTLALFKVYNITLVQYYLPLIILFSLAAADLLVSAGKILRQKNQWVFAISWILFLGFFSFGFWQSAQAHRTWSNQSDVLLIKNILAISQPEDRVFDLTGYHLFRESGYFFCCENFFQYKDFLSFPLPDFFEELKRNKTKFIVISPRLSCASGELKAFMEKNFSPSKIDERILVSKEESLN